MATNGFPLPQQSGHPEFVQDGRPRPNAIAAQLKVGSQRDKPREQLGLFENNYEDCVGNPVGFVELYLLSQNRMSADIVIGRTLACCLHPAAAWRRLSASGKALIVGTYFVVGYLAVLVLLFAR